MDEKKTASVTLNANASLESAAAFADAETREILNLLGDTSAEDAGGCCGGGCCSA